MRPFIALAAGLKSAGHDVALVASHVENRDVTDLGRACGVPVRMAGRLDPAELARIDELLRSVAMPIRQIKTVLRCLYDPFAGALAEASRELCRTNEIVIGHFMLHELKTAAEAAGIPCLSVFTAPVMATSTVAPGGIDFRLPGLNRLVWKFADAVLARVYLPAVNAGRNASGLAPARSALREVFCSPILNLVATSPSLFSKPLDWDDRTVVCGAFSFEERRGPEEIPGPLRDFLDSGPPPVYMTFGSMSAANSYGESLELFAQAARLAKVRAIIQAGDQRALPPSSGQLFYLDRLPHQLIFPRCAAVVHHGGAGTTHSVSRAGLPSVVVEHVMDQVFWGAVLRRAGIAPPTLHRRSLTAAKLARAIRLVMDSPSVRRKANIIGDQMRQEDGVRRAVQLIEESA